MKKILTGLQPTGNITLGNYIGAIRQMKNLQEEYDSYIFVADMHAITVPQEKENLVNNTRSLIDKAQEYYDNSGLKAYCGSTNGTKTIDFDDNMTGEYVKSEYKTLEELKNYLYSFLDKSLIKQKLELSDINKPKYYDNY